MLKQDRFRVFFIRFEPYTRALKQNRQYNRNGPADRPCDPDIDHAKQTRQNICKNDVRNTADSLINYSLLFLIYITNN